MKIILMGTPGFAVPVLQSLLASQHEIIAVYTKEPKLVGRGYQEAKSPIHQLAEENNLPVYTPHNFKSTEEIENFKALHADVAVVAAYGLLLPKAILDAPLYGCINIHPSKLPRWRGAAPIQRAILAGDKVTEICIMQMDEGMDTGDVLLKKELAISPQMTAKELHDSCANIGAELIIHTLEMIGKGTATPVKQSAEGILHAAKVTRADEKINWSDAAYKIHCQIRAFSPRPAAYFTYNGEVVKIISAEFNETHHSYLPGTVVDEKLTVACGSGLLMPTLIQREGRKMIYTDAFLRGFPIPPGAIL